MQKLLFSFVAYYLRNTTLERGRYRLLKWARPIGRKIGRTLGRKVVRTKSKFVIELDLRDWIPQDIYLTGEFEPETTAIVKKLVKPGDSAIDVGANIGYFSLLFAHCVGNAGRVYSFEPAPAVSIALKNNIKLNNYKNIEVNNFALSDHSGLTQFYLGPEDNTGLSSFRKPRQSTGSFDVELKPFDDLSIDDHKITLVKIDVEGAELQVLRGMTKLLQDLRPNLLLEITDSFLRELDDSMSSLFTFLDQFGYECYMIENGIVCLLKNYPRELPVQWNALFTCHKL